MNAEVVQALYRTFRSYPLRPRINGCPHCELEAAEASLHRRALAELSWVDFDVYPFKAMTTFGDVDDFKHFLPRLFELHAAELDAAPYDVEILFGKLAYANWRSWPESEVAAVVAFIASWVAALSERAPGSEQARDDHEELVAALEAHAIPLKTQRRHT